MVATQLNIDTFCEPAAYYSLISSRRCITRSYILSTSRPGLVRFPLLSVALRPVLLFVRPLVLLFSSFGITYLYMKIARSTLLFTQFSPTNFGAVLSFLLITQEHSFIVAVLGQHRVLMPTTLDTSFHTGRNSCTRSTWFFSFC